MTAPGARVPLYEYTLRLHRLNPDGPLRGVVLPPEPDRGQRYRRDLAETGSGGARTAAVLDQRLGRPLSPVSLRLLDSALAQVPVPRHRDPAVRDLSRRHPPALLRTVGRWLVRRGTGREAVAAGLALLAETAVESDVPLILTVGLLGSPFGRLPADALERLPNAAATPALGRLAGRTTGTVRTHCVHALNRIADPRAHYPWWQGPHPLADPDRPADPQAVHWLRRRAADHGDFNGYFAAETLVAADVERAIADPHADGEVVDQTGRLLRATTDCAGTGATLARLDNARELLTHYADHVGRLAPTADRCHSVLALAGYLADPRGEAAVLDRPPGGRAALLAQLTALLREPGWPARLAELTAWPTGNLAGWSLLTARRTGLLPDGPGPQARRRR
ncbi:hypothetical protein [Kitasatospora cineracea]|uniref:Uncharacterized protein n=1 Tax=Kitasatospora cineracea TaxID=88074 RepID=A0A3N4RFP6_9ACTN|nr:hypothetical protein [Kitasatospora cineracea]RPE29635.1 hypothetical protein EDD38_6793 [Kitasatospora cineracea]